MATAARLIHATHDVVMHHSRLAAAFGALVLRAHPIAVTVFDTAPGMGTVTTLRVMAGAMGLRLNDLRLCNISDGDLRVVTEDGIQPSATSDMVARWAAGSHGRPTVILLDEAGQAQHIVIRRLTSLINANRDSNGICAIAVVTHGDGEDVAATIRDALGTIVGRTVETVSLR